MEPAGDVTISYEERSQVALDERLERELVVLFEHLGISTTFKGRDLPIAHEYHPPYGSIVSEHLPLILMAAGAIVSKKLLEKLTEDLYGVLKKVVTKRATSGHSGWPVHTALLLDLQVQGHRERLAISFDDEVTLEIALWRLTEHLRGNPTVGASPGEEGFVELTYPLPPCNHGHVSWLTPTSLSISVLGVLAIRKLHHLLPFYDVIGLAGYLAPIGLAIVVLWLRWLVLPCFRRRRFIERFQAMMQMQKEHSSNAILS